MKLLKRSKIHNSLTKVIMGLGQEPAAEPTTLLVARKFHYSTVFAAQAAGQTAYSNTQKWYFWTQKQKFAHGMSTAAALDHNHSNVVAFPTKVKSNSIQPAFTNFAQAMLNQVEAKAEKAPVLQPTPRPMPMPSFGGKKKQDELQYSNKPFPTAPTPRPGM